MAIRARFSVGNGREGVRAEWGIHSEGFWARERKRRGGRGGGIHGCSLYVLGSVDAHGEQEDEVGWAREGTSGPRPIWFGGSK